MNLTCRWTFLGATLGHEGPGTRPVTNLPAESSPMPNIGPMELIIVLVIVLLIFGPKRLPGLGRQLGTGMREFKESVTGKGGKDDSDDDDDADRPAERKQVEAALGRPEGEQAPLEGEPVRERAPR